MLPTTYQHLEARGYLKGEEKVDRSAITEALVTELLNQPVTSNDLGEVEDKALTSAELRSRVLGQPDDEEVEAELDRLVTSLTAVGSKGKAQNALANGFVLLSARVTRKIISGDIEETKKRNGRFITENPDLIELLWWGKQAERTEGNVQELKRRHEMGVQRQPQLQTRLRPSIEKLHTYVALQLPVGS